MIVFESLVFGIGRSQILQIGERHTVGDLLEDQGLQVEQAGGRHARIVRLGIDLPFAYQRGLQKIHFRGGEFLVDGRELRVGEVFYFFREHPQPVGVILLRGRELVQLVQTVEMRLLRLKKAKKLSGVKRAWCGKCLEDVRGGLVDAGLATHDLLGFCKSRIRDFGRLDDVQPHRRPLADLHMMTAEHADGRINAARFKFGFDDIICLDFKRHGLSFF